MTCPWQPPDRMQSAGPTRWLEGAELDREREAYEQAHGDICERVAVRDVVMSDGTTWREWGYRGGE